MTRERPHAWVYKTALWQRLRAVQLLTEPLCRYHRELGQVVPATVVDHIKPHKGDRNLAFDPENLQSLCKDCHDMHAQSKDRGEPVAGCDADGFPLDPNHRWGE